MDFGIPEEQIAIKTADKNELKNVDLLSPSCPIRFIITVNALKEGWDCPFAYVLATVANKTSSVDVEQILGRVLRLPNTHKNTNQVLNISYVITSSDDFHATLERVVKGLNAAGFSSKDYYAKEADVEPVVPTPSVQLTMDDVQPVDTPDATDTVEDDLPEVDVAEVMAKIEAATKDTETVDPIENDELFATAIAESEAYDAAIENMEPTAKNLAPEEVRDKMSEYRMNDEFAEEASAIEIPQFMQVVGFNMFSENSYELLRPEHLAKGFTLRDKDTVIDFSSVNAEMFRVDVDDGQNPAPKAWRMNANDSAYFKEMFNSQPSEKRLAICKGMIIKAISKMDCIHDKELQDYINRVLKSMTEDQIADLEKSPYPYIIKIKEKVKALLAEHAEKTFDLWLNQDKIECVPNYKFPSSISPISVTTIIPKSLYTAEEDMNEQEIKLVWELSALDNIKWWHRNISRLGFCINGSINAYPDIIAMTESGRILLVEPKGDHLENEESKLKAKIGDAWSNNTDKRFRYFMVFDKKSPDYPGAYSHDEFMEIVKGL
jgi:type III restriction enzyme